GVRDDLVARRQFLVVDPHHHGKVGAVGGGGDDHLLGPGLEVFGRLLALGKDAGAFERDLDAQLLPRQFGRVALCGDADLAAPGIDPVFAGGDLAAEAAVDAVAAQDAGG